MSAPFSQSGSGRTHIHTHTCTRTPTHTVDLFHLNYNLVISWKLPGAAYAQEGNTLSSELRRSCWWECSICRYRGWINGAGKTGREEERINARGRGSKRTGAREICRGSTLLPPPPSLSFLSVSFTLTLLHASALITVHQRSKECPINQRTALEPL